MLCFSAQYAVIDLPDILQHRLEAPRVSEITVKACNTWYNDVDK
jgi:hypothetical protein